MTLDVKVRVLPNGDRRVTVTVPLPLCVAAVGFMTPDPVGQADRVAVEVAMHALAEKIEEVHRG